MSTDELSEIAARYMKPYPRASVSSGRDYTSQFMHIREWSDMCSLAQAMVDRIAADAAKNERLAVPRGRLMAWIHNYGDQKQPEFIADLKAVLGMEDDA